MQPIQLDERLSLAMDLFPACEEGADIGTDHGRLPCRLLEEGRCRRMILSDISPKALSRAEALVQRRGLQGRATLVVADGLDALTHRVDCVSIMGMGGRTIAQALRPWPGAPGRRRPWCFPHIQSFRKCVRPWKKRLPPYSGAPVPGR